MYPVICLEVVLTLAMLGVWELCRRRNLTHELPLHILFLVSCLAPVGIASVAALRVLPFQVAEVVRHRWFWPMGLALGAAPLGVLFRRPRRASRILRGILLYSWPVLLVVLIEAGHGTLLKYSGRDYADGPLAGPTGSERPHIRVVWILFDELSQTIAFANRPAYLTLPNFDRLKRESFCATAAVSPANTTQLSIPSLILGEQVLEVIPRGPDDLHLRLVSHTGLPALGSLPDVFSTARALGFNTALTGWYLPYGRVLNHNLTKCYWTASWLRAGTEEPSHPEPLPGLMWRRLELQLAALPLVGHVPRFSPAIYYRQAKVERFSWIRDRSIEIAADPDIGLAMIHLPIPHPPAITRGQAGYLDNLELADRTLGVLRRSMEQSGVWDTSAVLVSADHGWRTGAWRGGADWTDAEEAVSHQDTSGVPFLLKLPGQTAGLVYDKPLPTLLTREVITSILTGKLAQPGQVSGIIERTSAAPRSPAPNPNATYLPSSATATTGKSLARR